MLAIRMQRTGRKGHAQFRLIVQESRLSPSSGKVVARLGSYDPHAKAAVIDKEKVTFYLDNGAQPSDRVARLLKAEGVKLPAWIKLEADKQRKVRNPDKRRSTAPDEPVEPVEAEAPAESETPAETSAEEGAAEPEAPAEEEPAEPEKPAEETPPAESAEKPAEDEPEKA